MNAAIFALATLAVVTQGQFVTTIRIPDDAALFAIQISKAPAKRQDPTPCITVNMKRCQSQFDIILGFDTSLDWKNSFDFSKAIDDYIDENGNLLNLCYASVRSTTVALQFSLYNLLSEDGTTPFEAYNYVQTYESLDFLCSAGFDEAVKQYQCLKDVSKASPDYDACMSEFSKQLGQNPQQFCRHVNTTSSCLQAAYSKGCQFIDPRGAGWFGCENFRRTFEATCYETTRCFVH